MFNYKKQTTYFDRAFASGAKGQRFESSRAYQKSATCIGADTLPESAKLSLKRAECEQATGAPDFQSEPTDPSTATAVFCGEWHLFTRTAPLPMGEQMGEVSPSAPLAEPAQGGGR